MSEGVLGKKYLFALLSQRLFGQLLFGRIIVQAIPKQYFRPFYVSITIVYIYLFCLTHRMVLYDYILMSIRSYTK